MKNSGLERHAKATSVIFAALCIAFAAGLLILPKADWSENENRRLASFPELTAGQLANGEYLSDVEDYLTDHFPLRDFFVSVNTRFNTLLGRSEINDVFICSDGYLMDKYQSPTRTEDILEAFNRLPASVGERSVTLLLAPTASAVYSELLPPFAQQADQLYTMQQYYDGFAGNTVDVAGVLRSYRNEHQLYYRTDHHWTTYGAYYAYTELCKALKLDIVPFEEYDIKCVSEDFRGTTYSKVNDFSVPGEEMYAFSLPGQSLSVDYGDGNASDSLYNEDYLTRKDKYSYFLDNIHELIVITNPSAQTDRELVIIKDSYANCLVPFLTEHFTRISVIDPRYYRSSVIDYINADPAITDVLILYNMGTIDTDSGAAVIF